MPDTIRHRVQQIVQQFWSANGQQGYAETRNHVLRSYEQLYQPVSDGAWDRELRPAVMRAVQKLFEDMES